MYGIRYEFRHTNGRERIGWLLNGKGKPKGYDSYEAARLQIEVERERTDHDMATTVRYQVMPLTKPERTPQP